MLGGGGYGTGYGMSGNLMTDPQTGLLMDPNSGNLIDPSSGMVIGRRVVQPNYGYNPYGYYRPPVIIRPQVAPRYYSPSPRYYGGSPGGGYNGGRSGGGYSGGGGRSRGPR